MLWLILLLLAAGLVALLVLYTRKERRLQRLMLKRFRATPLYRDAKQLVTSVQPDYIEQVLIRPESLTLKVVTGRSRVLDFRAHHYDVLRPGPLLALTQAVAMDVPLLQNTSYYTFSEASRKESDGWYCYTIRHERKDYMLHVLRDRGQ